jgi:hypothetical protein
MRKSIIVAIVLLLLAAGGITTLSQVSSRSLARIKELEQKETRRSITIRERVELAKLKGRKEEIVVPGTVSLHPVAKTVDEMEALLSRYSLVLADPNGEIGYLGEWDTINSWYKFGIVDLIIQSPPQPTFARRELPQELMPLKNDEFLVPVPGGTVTIDGVKVTKRDQNFRPFDQNKRYLLLVSFDPATKVAELVLGSQAVLTVNSDNSLDARWDQQLLQQAIKKFHEGSLDQLKRNKQNISLTSP